MANELNNQIPVQPSEEMELVGQTPPVAEEPTAPMAEAPISEPGSVPMSEEEMRSDLERNFEEVESQNKALETGKFISRNKLKNLKIQLLQQLYQLLSDVGVDANNPESIKNFLTMLEERDPDLLTLFETAFNSLSPELTEGQVPPTSAGEVEENPEPNLMNKYDNLQEQILR